VFTNCCDQVRRGLIRASPTRQTLFTHTTTGG